MNIFQVVTRADTIGGAQKHIIDLCKALKVDGHDVTVISGSSNVLKNVILNEKMSFIGIDSFKRSFSCFDDLKTLFILFKVFLLSRPDIVALHSVKAGFLGRIACFFSFTPVYFTAHGWSHIREASGLKKKCYIRIEKSLSLLCRKVICVSRSDLIFANEIIGIKSCKLCLVENGVHAVPSLNNGQRQPGSKLKLLSVVRFQAPKDFDTLLQGLHKIKEKSWVLNILGDGDDIALVREQILELGLSKKINLLGFIDNIDKYYNDSDAILLISRSEGLPMSLIEGMSCSKALIASDVGGVPELVIGGWNGFLIPPQDSDYLGKCLTELIDSPRLVHELGINSKIHFENNYDFDTMYQKLILLYEDKK